MLRAVARPPAGEGEGDMLKSVYDTNDDGSVDEADTAAALTGTQATAITNNTTHRGLTNNPHTVTATQVGLGSADDTADADKPVSTAAQTALDLKEDAADKNAVNGYAGLDASSKINPAQLPALAISETYVVNTEVAQLALTVQEGDIAVRSDENKTYIALNDTNADMGDWQEMLSPTAAVTSVFGRSGAVTAQANDYDATEIENFDTEVGNHTDVTANTAKVGITSGQASAITANTAKTGVTTEISNVVEDTTPELGGDLDLNEFYLKLVMSPAADHKGSGLIGSVTVDVNAYGIGAALYIAADGHYEEADADAAATMPCVAIALEAGTGTKKVLFLGIMKDDSWTFTPGGAVYVSTTAGTLSTTAPTGTGKQVQKVGTAITADIVLFNPSPDIIELA
ncbi:MAG: hypothetical protein KAS59_06795 [Alphaproteobacteria bacterium]|nr:hypothetical protein [Alphaproteobacteria bacterium]